VNPIYKGGQIARTSFRDFRRGKEGRPAFGGTKKVFSGTDGGHHIAWHKKVFTIRERL